MVNQQDTLESAFEKCRVFPFPNSVSFQRFLWTFQFSVILFCATVAVSYVFQWTFAQEIGARPATIDTLAHARRLTAVLHQATIPDSCPPYSTCIFLLVWRTSVHQIHLHLWRLQLPHLAEIWMEFLRQIYSPGNASKWRIGPEVKNSSFNSASKTYLSLSQYVAN